MKNNVHQFEGFIDKVPYTAIAERLADTETIHLVLFQTDSSYNQEEPNYRIMIHKRYKFGYDLQCSMGGPSLEPKELDRIVTVTRSKFEE